MGLFDSRIRKNFNILVGISNLEHTAVIRFNFLRGWSLVRDFGSQLGEYLPPRINWNYGFQDEEHGYQSVYEKKEIFHDDVLYAGVIGPIENRVDNKADEGQGIDDHRTQT